MQSYFCFKCSQQIPEPELERGQVVLTKEGKLFCLRCLRRVQTRYPILLFASFFLFTFLFLIQIFQWISQGGHLFNSAVSAQKLEERLEEYLKREELEEKLLKQRSSLRKEAVALTEQEILPYFDQITALKKQIQLLQENTVSSEIPRNGSSRDPEFTENASLQAFQKQLDQQLKAFADFQNHLQSLHHKIETLTQEQKLLSQKWIELQKMSLSVGEKPHAITKEEIELQRLHETQEKGEKDPRVTRNSKAEFTPQAWLERLKDRNPQIRMAAVLQISELENPEVNTLLLEMLKDENSYVRQAAIKSLGDRQVQQAVPLLIQALEDPYKGVKLATLKALYQITQKEWGQEYPRLDLQKKMIQEYQQWWKTTQSK